MVVLPISLCDVKRSVLLGVVMMLTKMRPIDRRPKSFDCVGVNVAIYVGFAVVYDAVILDY